MQVINRPAYAVQVITEPAYVERQTGGGDKKRDIEDKEMDKVRKEREKDEKIRLEKEISRDRQR